MYQPFLLLTEATVRTVHIVHIVHRLAVHLVVLLQDHQYLITVEQNLPLLSPNQTPWDKNLESHLRIRQLEKSTALAKKLKDEEMRKNIIMRMQLTLQFENYYDGEIDGIMGPKTRAAVLKYKKDKIGSTSSQVLDAETLNLFGISGF